MSVAKKLAKKSVDEKLLKKLVPLNTLGADRLRELAEKADIENASPGRTLFKRGDTDAKTYYLLSGELEVQLANGQNVSIKADTPAALHPLLDARPRPATAVVKSAATLLVIDAGLLDILVNYDHHQSYEVAEIQSQAETDWLTRYLQSLSAMNIPVKNIEHLMQRMHEVPVRAGEAVIRQTDSDPQHYYVVKEGRCVVTKQASSDKTPIRIAELSAGISFGEEALLADQPRNASITMLTDGRLMRLAKADFTQLLADPALHYVSYAQAQQMVQAGAIWLDTRSNTEHRNNTIVHSVHIPLMALRTKVKELNAYGKYIAFCDSANRAAAAAFLLRQMGFSAYVLADGLRDVPATVLRGSVDAHAVKADAPKPAMAEQLKLRHQDADTGDDLVRRRLETVSVVAAELARAEAEQLRAQLLVARTTEQGALQRLAQQTTITAQAHDAAHAEQTQLQQRVVELEASRAQADRALMDQQERVRVLQAKLDEYTLGLTAADAAYDAAQNELDGLSQTHQRVTEILKQENTQLQTRIAATSAEIEHVKTELERAVESNRTADEALQSAEREIARLRAEADAAQRNVEESLRRASESESLQASILKEVQRKIEAAELMRLEAEEQAQRAREAAELSRKRAEQESRKVAEAEAARRKAQDEIERRARLTDEIRKKADVEMLRLKKEADTARAHADDAQKKSQLADAARRRLEAEIQTQQAQTRAQAKPADKPATTANTPAVENDLDDLERELAQLQQKLESKKRAAVARNQQVHQAEEKHRANESEIVQNVYDVHQKTQKLPVFKPNQAAPNDVGKVRKSGWISDSILWETTIGLREDSEAEKFLDNENAQRANAAAATAKRQETNARALSSGELKSQEAKRSVFTARESAPTIQRHMDVSDRSSQRIGLIAALSAAAVAVGIGGYVIMHKPGSFPVALTNSATSTTTPALVAPDVPLNARGTAAAVTTAPAGAPRIGAAKSPSSIGSGNGAIIRKENLAPTSDSVAGKAKAEIAKPPARKPVSMEQLTGNTPAASEAPRANPSTPASAPMEPEHDIKAATSPPEPAALHAAPEEQDEPAPADAAPVVPTFTDAPRVN